MKLKKYMIAYILIKIPYSTVNTNGARNLFNAFIKLKNLILRFKGLDNLTKAPYCSVVS